MPTVLERLNTALHEAMQADPSVLLLGEDILDPYGGAFKVTRGLSTRFPGRVLATPISEAAIVGLASGLALRGFRPVVEIMFGDFVTLIADQLVNHAAKFRWMYADQVRVPLVVRTPMGGRRGYGPTHSQSLEKLFLGVPGLTVVAPNSLVDPAALLGASLADEDPVLFIEHKLLYPRPWLSAGTGELSEFLCDPGPSPYPCTVLRPREASLRPRLTMATYGYNFELARQVALALLFEQEIAVEIVLFTRLSPFDLQPLLGSLARTGRLLTVEEGARSLGWGAEVLARTAEGGPAGMRMARVAGRDLPIANARSLEDAILPSLDTVRQAALALLDG